METPFYIVATPIGNREDITTRALQVLGDVQFIVAEDTRHTGQLLTYFGIKKPLLSFRDGPATAVNRTISVITERLLRGESGAYVTDAGTPGVSDPGWRLVSALQQTGITVVPVPGPSALTALLSISDVPLDEYRFVGFLPKKKGHATKLQDLMDYLHQKEHRGVILYESPKRVRKTLTELMELNSYCGVLIGRELTKKFETIYRGNLAPQFIEHLPEKGEYVILLHNVVALT